ncbi:MAG: septal ring lytic transglycosylase RlpA family protein [Sphingobium sp.]
MIRLIQSSMMAFALFAAACERAPSASAEKPDKNTAVQAGEASFYGKEFGGHKTATGETLKLDDMTAASRTLPLGTHVQVTNKDTGQSARVRINDRGPYAEGRVIDLTPKAARQIGLDRTEGVAPVTVTTISSGTAAPKR